MVRAANPAVLAPRDSLADVQLALAYLRYGMTFPDFPKNFTPPAYLDPQYVPPNSSTGLELMIYITAVLTVLVVVTRLWVRSFVRHGTFGIDDWFIIPAFIFTMALSAIQLLLVKLGGVGHHVYDLPFYRLEASRKLEISGVLVFYTAVYFTKMSICFFLLRLFGQARNSRGIIYATMGVYTATLVASIIQYALSCVPFRAVWDIRYRLFNPYKCIDVANVILGYGIILTIGDFWLLLFPIRHVLKLQASRRTKTGVIGVFALGAVACAGGIYKCIYVPGAYRTFDPSWKSINFLIGSQLETTAGIIAASLPALNVLIVAIFPRALRERIWSSRKSSKIQSFISEDKANKTPSRLQSMNPASLDLSHTTFTEDVERDSKSIQSVVSTPEKGDFELKHFNALETLPEERDPVHNRFDLGRKNARR